MLGKLPRRIPPLSLMLADLGHPPAAQLARSLGVSRRTVFRWLARDEAPRPVMLALFWLTSWGQSAVECDAINAARLAAGLADSHRRDAEARARELARVLALADFGSANEPLSQPPQMPARVVAR